MKDTRTNQELERIIAEWIGVKCQQCADGMWDLWIGEKRLGVGRGLSEDHAWQVFCPGYCTDLNAIHDAVKKLPDGPFTWWSNHLMQIVGTHLKSVNAGPRERAEALVAVIEGGTK